MAAKVVQAGSSFSLRHLQDVGKTALQAAKKKVIMKEVKNSMRKNVAAAEKRMAGKKDPKTKY